MASDWIQLLVALHPGLCPSFHLVDDGVGLASSHCVCCSWVQPITLWLAHLELCTRIDQGLLWNLPGCLFSSSLHFWAERSIIWGHSFGSFGVSVFVLCCCPSGSGSENPSLWTGKDWQCFNKSFPTDEERKSFDHMSTSSQQLTNNCCQYRLPLPVKTFVFAKIL